MCGGSGASYTMSCNPTRNARIAARYESVYHKRGYFFTKARRGLQ